MHEGKQPLKGVYMANIPTKVPKRIASVLLNSLKGGVVPRIGLPYITVGREQEIDALLHDLALIEQGGASCRFLVGRYGSGKSFLLQTIRTHAMGRGFVVADADLSPERRLTGGQGQGLATYRELLRNISTKTRPEGGALPLILNRWIDAIKQDVQQTTGYGPEDERFIPAVEQEIHRVVSSLEELVHGFDVARVLVLWWRGLVQENEALQSAALRWLRGEYRTRTEAKQDLGINLCITDDDWYDYLKVIARFLVKAGYEGLIILIDELVNLYKIPHTVARQYNYEKILTMYNDTLQGKAEHIGIIFGGTPQAIEDTRRGLYSYEALRSRLTQGRFSQSGYTDLLAPVIHVEPLSSEELLVLTEKLTNIHAQYFGYETRLSEQYRIQFLKLEFDHVGANTHMTPRELIRDFIELLDIVLQHPDAAVSDILSAQHHRDDTVSPDNNQSQSSELVSSHEERTDAAFDDIFQNFEV